MFQFIIADIFEPALSRQYQGNIFSDIGASYLPFREERSST